MTPKKRILSQLVGARARSHVRPSELEGYAERPEEYQSSVNDLLRERLLEGCLDGEGRMTISLNEHRLDDVRRALRPVWARPAFWAAVGLVLALASTLLPRLSG